MGVDQAGRGEAAAPVDDLVGNRDDVGGGGAGTHRDDPGPVGHDVPVRVLRPGLVDRGDRAALDHQRHRAPPERDAASRTASRIFS